MTFIVEIDRALNWRSGYFKSRVMRRIWWGPFAVAQLRIPLDEYADRSKFEWRTRAGTKEVEG